MTHEQLTRFLAKIRFEERDEDLGECWIWAASKRYGGYGQFNASGRIVVAHRLSYEHFVGPIEHGLELDHLCRQPACVNPRHLQAVSHKTNRERGFFSPQARARIAAVTRRPRSAAHVERVAAAQRGQRRPKTTAALKAWWARRRAAA